MATISRQAVSGGVRISTAVLHEIVRQRISHLGFSGHTAIHDFQILASGHCFDRCDIAYIVGLELRGLSPNARRLMGSGEVRATEWSNATLAWRYKAAAMGVPFLPCRTVLGTDVEKHSAAKEIACPFTGMKLLAVPALIPDVGIIHVHRADTYGNCQIDGITIADNGVARASKRVIITAEHIVDTDMIREEPAKTLLPYWLVDAVCHVRFGSYQEICPTNTILMSDIFKNGWKSKKTRRRSRRSSTSRSTGRRAFPIIWSSTEATGAWRNYTSTNRYAGELPAEVSMARYNMMEFMVCTAAYQLEDGRSAVIGTGMPLAAAMLAQKAHAPNLIVMFEVGTVAPLLPWLLVSVADSCTQYGVILHTSCEDLEFVVDSCWQSN